MSERIDRLQGKVGQLRGDLAAAEKLLREALIDEAEFKVGDVVEANDREWKPAIVRRVFVEWGQVTYLVSYRRKSGDWMDRESRAWNGIRYSEAVSHAT